MFSIAAWYVSASRKMYFSLFLRVRIGGKVRPGAAAMALIPAYGTVEFSGTIGA